VFTGIIEGMGRVTKVQRWGELVRMGIDLPVALTDMSAGDSICINGACLTVIERRERDAQVDISPETLMSTTLGFLKPNDAVNVERALRLSDRLGGHLVTGHVDGIGSITGVVVKANHRLMSARVAQELSQYLVEKGSVAMEGVSLTVSHIHGDEFQVTLIPYTAQNTTLGIRREGDRVNIEVDIIGKYVERFVHHVAGEGSRIDKDFLAEHGFLD